jgi:hypothetical protein
MDFDWDWSPFTVIDDNESCPTYSMLIKGVLDLTGPSGGSSGKSIQLLAVTDIPDLSQFAIGVAQNGGGTDGEELTTLPAIALSAGETFWLLHSHALSRDGVSPYALYFGAGSIFATGINDVDFHIASDIGGFWNGDDAIELFYQGTPIDLYGDVNEDGTNQAWEYLDAYAYRLDTVTAPSLTFNAADWDIKPRNCADGSSTNCNSRCGPYPGFASCEAAAPSCALADIYVSEAHTDGDPEDFIEIYNAGAAECSLTDFQLDDSSEQVDLTFNIINIAAGGYWLGYRNVYGSFSSSLGDDGDEIHLCDPNGACKTVVLGPTEGTSGQCFGADGTRLCYCSATPGAENEVCPQPACDDTDPGIGSDMQAMAPDGCDGTFEGGACAFTCADGFTGGAVTCTDAAWVVVPCEGEVPYVPNYGIHIGWCAPGSGGIQSEADCITAAAQIGATMAAPATVGTEWASGCLWNGGQVQYSPFEDGSAEGLTDGYLCDGRGRHVTTGITFNYCASGEGGISTEEDCKEAATSIGATFSSVTGPEWQSGCLYHGGLIYYSAHEDGSDQDGSDGVLCMDPEFEEVNSDLYISQIADPNSSSGAANKRWIQIFNPTCRTIDLGAEEYQLRRWTNGNGNMNPPNYGFWSGTDSNQRAKSLTGTIAPGEVLTVCKNNGGFNGAFNNAVVGFGCDIAAGTDQSPANSNGDDNMALVKCTSCLSGVVTVDMFGRPGEDGSGTDHEFEDGTVVRTTPGPKVLFDASDWLVHCDGNQCDGAKNAAAIRGPPGILFKNGALDAVSAVCTDPATSAPVDPGLVVGRPFTVSDMSMPIMARLVEAASDWGEL